MKNSPNRGITTLGLSSLLTILTTLCLVSFTFFTLSCVQSHQVLTNAYATSIREYYAADLVAYQRLSQVNPEMSSSTVSFQIPISQTQMLLVELIKENERYMPTRWQEISLTFWQPTNTLPVWNGETGGK